MVTDNHYRWDFIQLSTDTKPTPATSPKVVNGSTLYTSDDSKLYVWYKDQWYEKTATGGGGGGGSYTAGDGIVIDNNTISADLVQETGTSESKIMSQNAVTIALNNANSIISFAVLTPNFPVDSPDGFIIGDDFNYERIYYADEGGVKLYYSENDYINLTGFLQVGICDIGSDPDYETYGFTITKLNGASDTPEIYVGQTKYIPEYYDEDLGTNVPASWTSLSFEQVGAGGGGGVKVLSTADYNYPTDNPTTVALWLLPPGQYIVPDHFVYWKDNGGGSSSSTETGILVLQKADATLAQRGLFIIGTGNRGTSKIVYGIDVNGDNSTELILTTYVINNLTNDSGTNALSAYQGKVLKGLIDALDARVTALEGN